MRRLRHALVMFFSGMPLAMSQNDAARDADPAPDAPHLLDPVKLRPLNMDGDNLFAVHRSHSSHASHRSSSGGGYVVPSPAPERRVAPAPAPAPSFPSAPLYTPQQRQNSQPVDPGRPEAVSPSPAKPPTPKLSLAEKRRLQIMRVQIALTALGLYKGTVDGTMNDETQEALRMFQTVKGYSATGLMTTETLNALGVPAVQ